MKELSLVFIVYPIQYYAMLLQRPVRTSAVAMTSSSNSNSDQPRSSKEVADVSILREVARNSLVHALNSVRLHVHV